MTIGKREEFLEAVPIGRRIAQVIGRFGRSARDLLFPPRCLLCHGWVASDAGSLCPDCAGVVAEERAEDYCPTCAASVAPYEVFAGRCRLCRHRRLRVKGTVRVGGYRAGLGQLIRVYKYHGREELEPILARWLCEVVVDAPWLDRVEAIVSVPTHWRHRLGRPLYPAELLAERVARETRLPHVPILRRVRAGPHQVGLSYEARRANVHGAFAVRRGVALHAPRVLIIDDVKTTGATIEECAKILHKAGAAEVYAAVLANAGFEPVAGRLPITI